MFEWGSTGIDWTYVRIGDGRRRRTWRVALALSGLEGAVGDADRVDQLDLLERVKSACAAAQARVTVDLAESQRQIAEQWREHARAVADAGDFESWRRARAMSRAASCPEADALSEPWTVAAEVVAAGAEWRPA